MILPSHRCPLYTQQERITASCHTRRHPWALLQLSHSRRFGQANHETPCASSSMHALTTDSIPSLMDIYFLNANNDLMDVISFSPELAPGGLRLGDHPDKCSAFLKRSGHEVILAHNSWMGFLSQTMSQTLAVNGDLVTFNAATPGLIGSITDFGYNNKGIMFNETTHRMSKSQVKPLGLWIFWRAALAEQFSGSITDFSNAISLDNTGTYLNGYMLVDAKTKETGLVEMSYRCFVYLPFNRRFLHGQQRVARRRPLFNRLRH